MLLEIPVVKKRAIQYKNFRGRKEPTTRAAKGGGTPQQCSCYLHVAAFQIVIDDVTDVGIIYEFFNSLISKKTGYIRGGGVYP